jgi:hypothetical protein
VADTMATGEIRYVVYKDPEGRHWIGRVEMVGRSPKGRRTRWRDLDTEDRREFGVGREDAGAETRDGAVDRYQERRVLMAWLGGPGAEKEAVRDILAAERLRGREPDRGGAVGPLDMKARSPIMPHEAG